MIVAFTCVCLACVVHRRNAARPASLLSDVLCRSHVLRVRTTTQTQKVHYRERRSASRACYLLPTNLPEQYQVSHQCASSAHLERTAHVSKYRFVPCIPMCPSQNFRCIIASPSNVTNAAPLMRTMKNVNIKIHAPTAKQSNDVGDTCECSASEQAQVCDPTPLWQAGATSIDVTWRKTFFKLDELVLRRTQGVQCFHSDTIPVQTDHQ